MVRLRRINPTRSRFRRIRLITAGFCFALCFACAGANADTIRVATAANFSSTIDMLAERFERETGHRVKLTKGSTGKLYTQIRLGAPFDLFLAADKRRPAMLERAGLAVAGSRFTYAVGELAVVRQGRCDTIETMVEAARRIAVANAELAPYGVAARQTLGRLDLLDNALPKLVTGENVGQTYALFHTGNADLAFVAKSQTIEKSQRACPLPPNLHDPIEQDAVAVKDRAVVRAFTAFLKSDAATAMIRAQGYARGYDGVAKEQAR